jgi:tripartite-type tricarboxylate transporter receptor subunit TctC
MGYKSGGEMTLAMLRGETQGRGSWSWASFKQENFDLLKTGAVKVLVQMSTAKAPELPDVPLVTELVMGEQNKQILDILLAGQTMAWPIFAPAETPPGRVKLLRSAYLEMLRNAETLAEAKRIGIDVDPIPGEEIQAMLARVYASPAEVVTKARQLAGR